MLMIFVKYTDFLHSTGKDVYHELKSCLGKTFEEMDKLKAGEVIKIIAALNGSCYHY